MWDNPTVGAPATSIWLEIMWHRQRAPQRTPSLTKSTSHYALALTPGHYTRSLLVHVSTGQHGPIQTPPLASYLTALRSSPSSGVYSCSSSNHASLTLTLTLPQHSPSSHWHSCHHHRCRLRRSNCCHRMSPSRTQSLCLRILPKALASW